MPYSAHTVRGLAVSRLRAAALATCLSLGGCGLPNFMTFPTQTRGNALDQDALAQLVPGTTGRKDVTALLGSPTARATFDDNTWIYISERTKPVIGGTNEIRRQDVYLLTFNDSGVLQSVDHKTGKDSQDVDVVSRVTASPGNNAGFMQQLLGNVGRFSPGGGAETQTQGSATKPGNF